MVSSECSPLEIMSKEPHCGTQSPPSPKPQSLFAASLGVPLPEGTVVRCNDSADGGGLAVELLLPLRSLSPSTYVVGAPAEVHTQQTCRSRCRSIVARILSWCGIGNSSTNVEEWRAGEKPEFNQTVSSASPSPSC